MRILVAEDDSVSRAVLEGLLKEEGHEVAVAVNGAQAWTALQQPDVPALIILDWMMLEMDGLEVLHRVRARKDENPPYVILLTAMDRKSDIVTGLKAGANDYLVKPFDAGELCARVEVGRRMIELQTALIESRERLAYEAAHDHLTGLLNRRAVLERLDQELARAKRYGHTLGVGMCDIDDFKRINDTYGHQTGDEVLFGLSRTLTTGLRRYDTVGRIGGEEFLVIVPMKEREDPGPLFSRLGLRVAETEIMTRSGLLYITISLGFCIPTSESTVDELLSKADSALYHAKNHGRERVECCLAKEIP